MTVAEDKKAIELLASRGYTKAERLRLQALVDAALGVRAEPGQPTPPAIVDPEVRRAALLDLKLWVNEWSTVAHARIKKKSWLIRLGLASRKSPKKNS